MHTITHTKHAIPNGKPRETRYAIRLSPHLASRLKRLARLEHRHLAAVIRDALALQLKESEKNHRAAPKLSRAQ